MRYGEMERRALTAIKTYEIWRDWEEKLTLMDKKNVIVKSGSNCLLSLYFKFGETREGYQLWAATSAIYLFAFFYLLYT